MPAVPPRAALALALLTAGCGGGPSGLPPFPEAVLTTVPGMDREAVFWLQAGTGLAGIPGRLRLAAGAEGWYWCGSLDATGAWVPFRGSPEAPALLGARERALPAGDLSFSGDPAALLEARRPAVLQQIRGLPVLFRTAAARIPAPREEGLALLEAAGLALLETGAEGLPRLLGTMEGALRSFSDGGVFDLRFRPSPELAAPSWGPAWHPPSPPPGVAFLRCEVPRDTLFPLLEQRLDAWGFPPPPRPASDFTAELHLLVLDGRLGLALAAPQEWLPLEEGPLLPGLKGLSLPGDGLLAPVLARTGLEVVSCGDAVFVTAGERGFAAALRRALERDRPRPFAERRVRWPRGTLGVVVDSQRLQEVLQAALPLPVPVLGSSAHDGLIEGLLVPESGALRLRLEWPRPPSQLGGVDMGAMGAPWLPGIEGALIRLLLPEDGDGPPAGGGR